MPPKMTDEEKARKFDEKKAKQQQFTKNWIANNLEHFRGKQHEYYLRNKVEHNRKCAIYQKKRYDEKKNAVIKKKYDELMIKEAEKEAKKIEENQKV